MPNILDEEAGFIISICTPPTMGETIAAVFLCRLAGSLTGRKNIFPAAREIAEEKSRLYILFSAC